jgi:hypothetical protein
MIGRDRRDRPLPAGISPAHKALGLALVTLLAATVAFLAGGAASALPGDPIQTRAGIPVGVDHSPAGAVAAADEYVASEQSTVERDPASFAALVAQDYPGWLRQSALAGARADRQTDPGGMRLWADGGQSFITIGAHRLDWYRGASAQVTLWVGQIFWGPGQQPCQVWVLRRAELVWRRGQWEVNSMAALPTAAPAPAELPQASTADTSGAAASSELGGFTPVSYGSPR